VSKSASGNQEDTKKKIMAARFLHNRCPSWHPNTEVRNFQILYVIY